MRVMLIDESRIMRNIQRHVLETLGPMQFSEAANGQDALSRVESIDPDLILVDWALPGMDGLAFVRACRARGRQTPVMMVTGESDKTRVLEAIRTGVNAYLIKPFTPEQLIRRVQEAMAKAGRPMMPQPVACA